MDLIADGSATSRRGVPRPLLIAKAALRELMEQANLQLVITDDDGEPLHIGRARRLATAALLVALIARSGGTCEFPGCHAKHHRANAHHIRWWRNGGLTDIENLSLLCPHHHRLVHHGWTMTRGPTALVFHRPDGTTIEPPPFQQAA